MSLPGGRLWIRYCVNKEAAYGAVMGHEVQLDDVETEMFVEGYKAVLVKDTSFKGLWKVSFTLREF